MGVSSWCERRHLLLALSVTEDYRRKRPPADTFCVNDSGVRPLVRRCQLGQPGQSRGGIIPTLFTLAVGRSYPVMPLEALLAVFVQLVFLHRGTSLGAGFLGPALTTLRRASLFAVVCDALFDTRRIGCDAAGAFCSG